MSQTKSLSWALEEIRSVRVQGAERIALFSLTFLEDFVAKHAHTSTLGKQIADIIASFVAVRPTEPCLRNSFSYVMAGVDPKNPRPETLMSRINEAILSLQSSGPIISKLGARKIKDHTIVYTHCHSGTVIDILHEAKQAGSAFRVRNTETRPLFQGRKTAKELAALHIPVEHYVDAAMRIALKHADIVLLGADAITDDRIYNKIGSELVCEVAHHFEIPVYICSHSWKYDPISKIGFEEEIEERSETEVWEKAPKGVTVKNFAFEKIRPELITGIVSELGILPFSQFISMVTEKYPWIALQGKKY